MLTFNEARKRHAMVASRVTEQSLGSAAELYAGVTGVGGAGGLLTLAVADTLPIEYAVLLATDDIAAAFAAGCQLDAFKGASPKTPYQARKLAELGWVAFRELADKAGHVQHGMGADQSDAWPVLRTVQEIKPDPVKMRRIAQLAGRMYAALAGARARRVENIPEEIIGVTQGDDFASLLPQEYALLGTDPTRRHLFQELLQRRCLQHERAGTERKDRGALVILRDESGSMMKEYDGRQVVEKERNEWAAAAMTALTRIAWEDKRPVVVVHFSTATKVQVLHPGDTAGVVRAQHTFLDGGTDIGVALRVGLAEVGLLASAGHKGADIVLVSDGGDAGGGIDSAVEDMTADGVRLFSVAIGLEFRGVLRTAASEYVHLGDAEMTSDAGIMKIAGAVL